MREFTLLFVCSLVARVASHQIRAECKETYYETLKRSQNPPSKLGGLKVEEVTVGETAKLNISWAVNIDASIQYLTGTSLEISGESSILCDYSPSFANANLTGLKQEWFHYLIPVRSESYRILATNHPYPPPGIDPVFLITYLKIQPTHDPIGNVPTTSAQTEMGGSTLDMSTPEPTSLCLTSKDITLIIFGVLATLMILSSCYIIYKICGSNTASSLDFDNLFANLKAPVSVLVVYPAVNSAFQGAVVALAEFLQLHCGCTVAIDMWQQGKIAELGPMRWLAEQVKEVDHVLIVSPLAETPSSLLSHSLNHSLPELSIPAAAHDLYPLILNMVASHAKNARELAKSWVVQLSEEKDCRSLPLELRACKKFCLMKDLNKLCKCLHAQRHSKKKLSHMIFRPAVFYNPKSTLKLQEATEKLRGNKPGISMEMQPLKSVLTGV